jgi:hypothetical protein
MEFSVGTPVATRSTRDRPRDQLRIADAERRTSRRHRRQRRHTAPRRRLFRAARPGIKGIAEPIDVYEVVATGALHGHFDLAARRGLTRFVGRERDLEQLQRAFAQATEGYGQIVAAMAEAGTGKSRVIYEFKRIVPKGCKVLESYSVSHGKASAWLPVLELLRRYFGIQDADDPVTRRDKVRTALTALDAALDGALPYLFGLLGIVEGADPLVRWVDGLASCALRAAWIRRAWRRREARQYVRIQRRRIGEVEHVL